MIKTFTEVVEAKAGQLFSEVKGAPQLAGYFTNAVPISIAAYLKGKMMETQKPEATLDICDLMQFSLKANKKGDSVALMPEFAMLSKGKEYINSDEVDFSIKSIEEFSLELLKNDDYITCARNALACKIFNDDGEWEDMDSKSNEKGLTFNDEADVSTAICSVFVSIIEILTNNKDSSNDIEYEIPGLGKFTVKPTKDGYATTLTFDKEFKSNCKSDKLSEIMAGMDI